MQLYKSRGFSEFFQDTFAFLKLNGKHFFKHFFIVNGIFLLILMSITFFFTKFYTEFLFGGILQGNNPNVFEDYINDNAGLFILLVVVFIVVALVAGTISYAFMPIYLKLYNKSNSKEFGTTAVINSYKQNSSNLIIFLICGVLLGIPLLLVAGIVSFILSITIIGILLLPLVLGCFMLFYTMTLMEYIENKKGIWECFGYSWTLINSKFWAAVSCVGLFYLMSYIIQNVISLIPYILGIASLFTTIEKGKPNPQEVGEIMTVVMLVIFFLSYVLGTVLSNIVQLNQGIVFYSLKEEKENINTKSEIDQIGSGE